MEIGGHAVRHIETAWERVKRILFGGGGWAAAGLAVLAGVIGVADRISVIDERLANNTRAVNDLRREVDDVISAAGLLKGTFNEHSAADAAQAQHIAALEQRVGQLEA